MRCSLSWGGGMKITDEMLVAFADGELDPEVHAHVESAIAPDPEIGPKVEETRRPRQSLTNTFRPIRDEQGPGNLKEHLAPDILDIPICTLTSLLLRGRNALLVELGRRHEDH